MTLKIFRSQTAPVMLRNCWMQNNKHLHHNVFVTAEHPGTPAAAENIAHQQTLHETLYDTHCHVEAE